MRLLMNQTKQVKTVLQIIKTKDWFTDKTKAKHITR